MNVLRVQVVQLVKVVVVDNECDTEYKILRER